MRRGRENKGGRGGQVSIVVSVTTRARERERERENRYTQRDGRRKKNGELISYATPTGLPLHPHLPAPRPPPPPPAPRSGLTSLLEIQIPRETVVMYRAAPRGTHEPSHRSPLPPVSLFRPFYCFSFLRAHSLAEASLISPSFFVRYDFAVFDETSGWM